MIVPSHLESSPAFDHARTMLPAKKPGNSTAFTSSAQTNRIKKTGVSVSETSRTTALHASDGQSSSAAQVDAPTDRLHADSQRPTLMAATKSPGTAVDGNVNGDKGLDSHAGVAAAAAAATHSNGDVGNDETPVATQLRSIYSTLTTHSGTSTYDESSPTDDQADNDQNDVSVDNQCRKDLRQPSSSASLFERRRYILHITWRSVNYGLRDMKAIEIFYDRLFSQHPSVRELFPASMKQQLKKIFQAISFAVRCLDEIGDDALDIDLGDSRNHDLSTQSIRTRSDSDCSGDGMKEDKQRSEASIACFANSSSNDNGDDEGGSFWTYQSHVSSYSNWDSECQDTHAATDATRATGATGDGSSAQRSEERTHGTGNGGNKSTSPKRTSKTKDSGTDRLIPVLQELGRRHSVSYGVKREHYSAVAECFVWTLQTYMMDQMAYMARGMAYDVADAWGFALQFIGTIMADAGDEALRQLQDEQDAMQDMSSSSEGSDGGEDGDKVATSNHR